MRSRRVLRNIPSRPKNRERVPLPLSEYIIDLRKTKRHPRWLKPRDFVCH